MASDNIDLCSFHDYEGATNATAFNQYNGLNVRISQCAALDKPILYRGVGRPRDRSGG